MFDDQKTDLLRRYGQGDVIVSALRSALSVAGPMGAIVGEFLTQLVPDQRMDRLQDFVELLDGRLTGLEDQFKARLHESSTYATFAEQVMVVAVRTSSRERHRDLAELLRTGLSKSDADLVRHQTVLNLLERLNDVQILILMRYGSFGGTFGDPELSDFLAVHRDAFPEHPTLNASEDARLAWNLYQHYEGELLQLGLLRELEGVVKASEHRKLTITPIGTLVLEAIGRAAHRSRP